MSTQRQRVESSTGLELREVLMEDSVPTGRQILQAAGARCVEQYLIFKVSRPWELVELGLDEIVDLRKGAFTIFLVFDKTASFSLGWIAVTLNGRNRTLLNVFSSSWRGSNCRQRGVSPEVSGEPDRR